MRCFAWFCLQARHIWVVIVAFARDHLVARETQCDARTPVLCAAHAMTVVIRPVLASEADALLVLLRAYWQYDGIAYDDARVRRGLSTLLADASLGRAYFVEDDALGAVGYCIVTYGFDLEFGGRHAWITDLYVRESHRGRGIGKQIFAFVDDVLRREHIDRIELVVEHDNTEARAFYEKLGFTAFERVPMVRRVPVSQL